MSENFSNGLVLSFFVVMAEMVDAPDLGSGIMQMCGSNPTNDILPWGRILLRGGEVETH